MTRLTGSSLDATARHLFRHLNDPKALRRNRIALLFFNPSLSWHGKVSVPYSDADFLARLHGAINDALIEIKDRLRRFDDPSLARGIQIVERSLLSYEPSQTVANQLGISRRQYARDKARILSMIAHSLLARSASLPDAHVCCVTTAALNACTLAAERGDGRRALTQLYEMAQELTDVASRITILATAAHIALDYADFTATTECMDRLKRAADDQLGGAGAEGCFADAVATLIEAEYLYEQGSSESAINSITRSVDVLRAGAVKGLPGAHLLLASALYALAERLHDRGAFPLAEGAIAESLLHLSTIQDVSAAFEARSLGLLAQIRLALERRRDRLEPCLVRFEKLAIKHGLLNQLAASLVTRSQLANLDGDHTMAVQFARDCITTIDTAGNNRAAAGKAVGALGALLSSTALSHDEASDFAQRLRRCIGMLAPASGNFTWAHTQLAKLELSLNRLEDAQWYAEAADMTAKSTRPARERARTLACLAEVEQRLGHRDRSKALIRECIEIAEQFERPRWLTRHYEQAARLTGDKHFLRLAALAKAQIPKPAKAIGHSS